MSDGELCRDAEWAGPNPLDQPAHQAVQVGQVVLVAASEKVAEYPLSLMAVRLGVDQAVS